MIHGDSEEYLPIGWPKLLESEPEMESSILIQLGA